MYGAGGQKEGMREEEERRGQRGASKARKGRETEKQKTRRKRQKCGLGAVLTHSRIRRGKSRQQRKALRNFPSLRLQLSLTRTLHRTQSGGGKTSRSHSRRGDPTNQRSLMQSERAPGYHSTGSGGRYSPALYSSTTCALCRRRSFAPSSSSVEVAAYAYTQKGLSRGAERRGGGGEVRGGQQGKRVCSSSHKVTNPKHDSQELCPSRVK